MNLSRNALFCLEIRLGIAILTFSVLLFGCSPEKNNTESRNKGTQFLPYSLQGNESKEHENSKNKMVPAIMTGDGKLQRLDNYQGGNFYAFKVDVEEGYFSENIVVPISVAMAKNIHTPNIPVVLQGKITDFLTGNIFMGENIYLFEDNTGTMVIKLNKNLCDNLPVERSQMIEIIGEIVLKYPENEIEVETVRECKPSEAQRILFKKVLETI
jgi:uncharacterized protein (TIGR00156 family)